MRKLANKNWFEHSMEYNIELIGFGQWDNELTLSVTGEVFGDEVDGLLIGVFGKNAFHDFEPFLTKEQIEHVTVTFYESALSAIRDKNERDKEAALDAAFERHRDRKYE